MLPLELSLKNTVLSQTAREQREAAEAGRRQNFNSISKHAARCSFLEERANYYRAEACKSILDYLKTTGVGDVSNIKNLYLLTLLENGFESLSSTLLHHWYSIGFVSSFLVAICVIFLMNEIGSYPLGSRVNSNDDVDGNLELSMARSYYGLLTGSLLCFLSSLIMSIIFTSQYVCLMINDTCKVWFVMKYGSLFHVPDIILGCGLIVLMAAIIMGIFLVTDMLTAYILLSVIGAFTISIIVCIALMLSVSYERWVLHFNKSIKAITDGKVD